MALAPVAGAPRALGLGVLLVVALLAGCIGGASDEDPVVAATSGLGTGVVEGVVTSDLIEPLPNATVVLIQLSLTAATNGEARYRFEGLPEGTWSFFATAPGYVEKVQTLPVANGTTQALDFRLAKAPSLTPYPEEIVLTGIIDLSVWWDVAPTGDCINDLSSISQYAKSCGGFASTGGLRQEIKFSFQPDVVDVVVELEWTPHGPLGMNLHLDTMAPCVKRGGENNDRGVLDPENDPCYWAAEDTRSPLQILVTNETMNERGLTMQNRTGNWSARVFAGSGMLGTGESGADIGVVQDQSFTYYVTLFHRMSAPEGYTLRPNA